VKLYRSGFVLYLWFSVVIIAGILGFLLVVACMMGPPLLSWHYHTAWYLLLWLLLPPSLLLHGQIILLIDQY